MNLQQKDFSLYMKFEYQLLISCAPLLAGLQIGHLVVLDSKNKAFAHSFFKDSCISETELACFENKYVVFYYRKNELLSYLMQPLVQEFLKKYDYLTFEIDELLNRLKQRYAFYCKTKSNFPHEIGIFLGYPIEDVIGYMENGGYDEKYSGYWKVYANTKKTCSLFQEFDLAKQMTEELLRQGVNPRLLLSSCYL